MNYRPKLLLLMSWTFMCSWAAAQPNLAFYPLTDQFNSFDYNPAFLSSPEKFTFSMFPLAGTSMGYNNQGVINSMASKFLEGSTITNNDYKDAFSNMVTHPFFHQNFEGSWLSFTFRSDIGFFNFRIKDSQYFLTRAGGEITRFIFSPDIQTAMINQPQYLPGQAVHYREYSLGYSHQSRDKRFTAGIRAKRYYGKIGIFSDISGIIELNEPNSNDYVLRTSGSINISFPDNTLETPSTSTNTPELNSSQIMDYIFNSGNPGMGLDLGIHYRLSPALSLSVSVIDLGKINWKNNLNSKRLEKPYPLTDFTLVNNNGVQITKEDSVNYSKIFDFDKLDSERSSFSKPMPTVLYAGIKYQISPEFSLSLTDRYVVVKHLSYNSLSVNANFEVNKKLSISTGYSMIADSYLNIPFALLYKGDFGQFYIGTDNLPALSLSSSSGFAGFSAGAAFYLFRERIVYKQPSDDLPFYRPRKIINKSKSGLIFNNSQKD